MDTIELRRFWKDVDVLATQAKRLPVWMRGQAEEKKHLIESRKVDKESSPPTKPKVKSAAG